MERSTPFEAILEALEATVARLEGGSLSLEEALAAFETGVRLARECEARLDQAERRVELLLREPDGTLRAEPFPAASGGTAGEGAADGGAAPPAGAGIGSPPGSSRGDAG